MATSGIINGTAMAVYVNEVKVAVLTGNSLSLSWPTRDTANKDSGSWMTKIPTRGNWSISGTAFFQFLSSGGYLTLFTAMTAKSLIAVEISDATSGDHYWHGFGYLTDLSSDQPDDEATTFTFTIEGSGQLYFTQLT
jgi:predicted secreted protein